MADDARSPEILWRPDATRIRRAHLTRFLERNGKASYEDLHRWSVEEPRVFWGELAGFCDLRWRRPPDAVLADGYRMSGARWFPGATLNYAENLLRFADDHPALGWRDERRARGELSYRQLRAQVGRAAEGLRRLGVRRGDRAFYTA